MRIDWKFLVLLGGSFLLFMAPRAGSSQHCSDCFTRRGWPFPYMYSFGFVGESHYVWRAMLGDSVVYFSLGVLIWTVMNAVGHSVREDVTASLTRYRTWGSIRLIYGFALFVDSASTIERQVRGAIEPRLLPANSAEWVGYTFGLLAFLSLAVWLMISGFRRLTASSVPGMQATAQSA